MARRLLDVKIAIYERYEMRNNRQAAEWHGATRSRLDCDESRKWCHEIVSAQLSLSLRLRLLVARSHKADRKCGALSSMTGRCVTHPRCVIMKVEP